MINKNILVFGFISKNIFHLNQIRIKLALVEINLFKL